MVVDSVSNAVAAVGTFTSFSVEPLNTPPVVRPGISRTFAPFTLNAGVVDDGNPSPPSATTVAWSQVGGPGTVAFGNRWAASTVATLSPGGDYILRVSAYDGAGIGNEPCGVGESDLPIAGRKAQGYAL